MNEQNPQGALEAAPVESREQLLALVRAALEPAGQGRAAVIVLQVDPAYARGAPARVQKVVQEARGQRSERLHLANLGGNRFALVASPIGYPSHANTLAEHLTRALDPRTCPLLRRALPYACAGVGVFPDHGVQAEQLIAHAEQALEAARNAGGRSRRAALARRRPAVAGVLRPLSVR